MKHDALLINKELVVICMNFTNVCGTSRGFLKHVLENVALYTGSVKAALCLHVFFACVR